MWWLENSCVCYSNNMFSCVCGAADDHESEKTEAEMLELLKDAHVIIPSSDESDGSAYLNQPIVRIGWYKKNSCFIVYRLNAVEKQDYLYLKNKTSKYLERNRVRFHIAD